MKHDIELLERLFSDDDMEVYKAILEKRSWINRKVILNGCLDYYIDENNKKRFFFLENLFDNVVAFHPVSYKGEKFDKARLEGVNAQLSLFNKVNFKTKIDLRDDAPFYVEYDLTKIDDMAYKILFPNFYFNHKEEDFNINYKDFPLDAKDVIKLAMIGNEEEVCIVLEESELINGVFFLPVVSKIYIAKPIEEDLFKELQYYCESNNATLEVITEKEL